MRCDQCQMLSINGHPCHETGCPNASARWDKGSETWIKQRDCFDCGCTVDEDDECCNTEEEESPEIHHYLSVRYNVDADGNVTEWQILDHGREHEQYFQGCGTAFTKYEHVATGIGDDAREALDDATESVAQQDHDITNDQWNEMLSEIR